MKNNKRRLGVEWADQLKSAFESEGKWTTEEIQTLIKRRGLLKGVCSVIRGYSDMSITPAKDIVDLDEMPPPWWDDFKPVFHYKHSGGIIRWKKAKVKVLSWNNNKLGQSKQRMSEVRQEISEFRCCSANVLDFLLENPDQIPKAWIKRKLAVYFWGTLYRDKAGDYIVRCLDLSKQAGPRETYDYCEDVMLGDTCAVHC
jgi:hypothetical protein